jgi:V8-like Glu-specific endopeptidase
MRASGALLLLAMAAGAAACSGKDTGAAGVVVPTGPTVVTEPAPTPAPTATAALGAVTLTAARAAGDGAVAGEVKLTAAAPAGGAVIGLGSDNAAASVPSSVTVAAGSTTQAISVRTYEPSSSRAVTISATYGGDTRTAQLTVTPTSTPGQTPPPAVDACGAVSGVAGSPGQRIINGTECLARGSSVVLVRLFDGRGRESGGCSGTVISSRAVLTAAHCLTDVGSIIVDGAGREMRAASFRAIPGYSERNADSPDVGVIIMEEPIPLTAVPLLLSREVRSGDAGVIAGYGDDERGTYGILRAGPITIDEVKARFLVAYYTGTGSNTCWGDSGGPLLMVSGDRYAIAGVTSGGDSSCLRGMSDFAKITNAEISSFILGMVPDAVRR